MGRFLPFLLVLFALAVVLRVDFLFTVAWFLVGLYALSRLGTHRAVGSLRIGRRFGDRAFAGDTVEVRLSIENVGRLPVPWLEVDESVPMDLRVTPFPIQVISLGGRRSRHFAYTLQCRRRGLYELGPVRLQTGDVLGVEQRVLVVPEARRLTVYPRIVPLERLGLPTRSALTVLPARTPLFEDPSRIMGVRDYQPGDSPRRMHWTASAGAGRLLVKQYQPAISRETLLCLDLNLSDYELQQRSEAIEAAIVVAASLANHMTVREHLPVGLATIARDPRSDGLQRISLQPRSERAHLMALLEVLAWVQPASGDGFADLVRQQSLNLAWGSTLLAITGGMDEALAQTLLYLKRSGHAIGIVLVQRPDRLQARNAPQAPAGMPVYRVWADADLVGLQ